MASVEQELQATEDAWANFAPSLGRAVHVSADLTKHDLLRRLISHATSPGTISDALPSVLEDLENMEDKKVDEQLAQARNVVFLPPFTAMPPSAVNPDSLKLSYSCPAYTFSVTSNVAEITITFEVKEQHNVRLLPGSLSTLGGSSIRSKFDPPISVITPKVKGTFVLCIGVHGAITNSSRFVFVQLCSPKPPFAYVIIPIRIKFQEGLPTRYTPIIQDYYSVLNKINGGLTMALAQGLPVYLSDLSIDAATQAQYTSFAYPLLAPLIGVIETTEKQRRAVFARSHCTLRQWLANPFPLLSPGDVTIPAESWNVLIYLSKLKILVNVASALAFIHQKDKVHGCLSLDSVYIDYDQQARLVWDCLAPTPVVPQENLDSSLVRHRQPSANISGFSNSTCSILGSITTWRPICTGTTALR